MVVRCVFVLDVCVFPNCEACWKEECISGLVLVSRTGDARVVEMSLRYGLFWKVYGTCRQQGGGHGG